MKQSNDTVLLAEDQDDDVFLMKRAWRRARIVNPLQIVRDGQEAVNYLSAKGPYADRTLHPLPCLVFLDLKMPRLDGFEVLRWMKSQPGIRDIDVIVITSSGAVTDIQQAYRLGAKSYIVKPPTAEQLSELVRTPNQLCLDEA